MASISMMSPPGCLAFLTTGMITKWLYRDPARAVERMTRGEGFPLTGREVVLTPPLTEAQVRALRVGDVVLING